MARIPASIRNSNPGAIYPGPSARKFGSTTYESLTSKDGEHKIATFADPVQGGAALFDLLLTPRYCGKAMSKAIETWCGGYHVESYLDVLVKRGGCQIEDTLSKEFLSDPAKAIPFAKAMAWQEAGKDFPMTDEQWATAHRSAMAPVAPSFSPANDVPSPKFELRQAIAWWTRVRALIWGTSATAALGFAQLDPGTMQQSVTAWRGLAQVVADTGQWAWGLGGRYALAAAAAGVVFAVVNAAMGKKA